MPRPMNFAACAELVASKRWIAKVLIPGDRDDCWLWTGATTSVGYGETSLGRSVVLAHRVALVASLGRDIRPDMQAGHTCHDRALAEGRCVASRGNPCVHRRCVNPAHLQEQSSRENNLAGGTLIAQMTSRTHCPQGHELRGDNLRASQSRKGHRACRVCGVERNREVAASIRDAHRALGLGQVEYGRLFGRSHLTAAAVTMAIESGASVSEVLADPSAYIRGRRSPAT